MATHDIAHLHTRVDDLRKYLSTVADNKDFDEFINVIHRPGWTSVAEHTFVLGIVDAMHSHAKTLGDLKQVLLAGGRAVITK